ncbi:hypothetical protein QVD17_20489 [Tagetes erecta]|uniref:Uncharacterized protein n=1 Tax=Tagetes erecta TaxID=13708 RepID=A0AAD8KLB4_TARER|nr:hypothetical protein QVD17_20489 [Tagetes erecta]
MKNKHLWNCEDMFDGLLKPRLCVSRLNLGIYILPLGYFSYAGKILINMLRSVIGKSGVVCYRILSTITLADIDFELKISPPTWDFPVLTTLSINDVTFSLQPPNDGASKSIELFSQLPNLTTLALDNFMLLNIDTFVIMSSKLETLSLTGVHQSCKFVVSAPKLSSFTYNGMVQFSLLANDLLSLKTVKFHTIYHRSLKYHPEFVELMINAFQQLYKANSLILNLDALKVLSVFPELLERLNCPFRSLQSLTLVFDQLPQFLSYFNGVYRYFRESSPDVKVKVELDPIPSL